MYSYATNDDNLFYLVKEDGCEYWETTKAGIIFLDRQLTIKNMNQEIETLLNVDRQQIIGRKAQNAFKHLGYKFLKVFAVSEYDDYYSTNLNLRIKHKMANIYINSLKVRNNDGSFGGLIIVIQDVSSIKDELKLVETKQQLTLIGEMVAGVAHHVRTPLTTISGYLQVIANKIEAEEYTLTRSILEILLSEVGYINNVVKELILYAKPPIYKKPNININLLIEDVLRVASEIGNSDQQLINQELAPVPVINADANLLKQAILNIVQNALEAIDQFGVLNVKTWVNSDFKMLIIAIIDNGCGIAPHNLPLVFDPFYTTKIEHIGLGLSSANRIVNEHNGFINITSKESIGTKVHIYLPLFDNRPQQISSAYQQVLNLY